MTDDDRYSYTFDPAGDTTAARVLRMVGAGKAVLEIGTAVGSMTRFLKEYNGCRVTGIEIDADMAAQAAPYCERIIVGDVETMDLDRELAGRRFDAIVAADVLEHLRDPRALLGRLRPLLATEGALILSVPNVAHNTVIAALLRGRFPYREKGLLDRTHLHFFTCADFEDLLLAAGYLPVAWERNRVPEAESELAAWWHALPEADRTSLRLNPEGQTYQFVVRAVPAAESSLIGALKAKTAELEGRLAALGEALEAQRGIAAGREREIEEARREVEEARREIEEARRSGEELRREREALEMVRRDLVRRIEVRIGDRLRRFMK